MSQTPLNPAAVPRSALPPRWLAAMAVVLVAAALTPAIMVLATRF